jgi:hypothetical protein
VRIAGRLHRLEDRADGDSADVQECERFLTALIAFGQHRECVTPEMAAAIHAEARRVCNEGGLPTHMRDLAATRGEG